MGSIRLRTTEFSRVGVQGEEGKEGLFLRGYSFVLFSKPSLLFCI